MSDGPIDRYLDDLQTRLWLPPGDVRRIVAEAEDHLREAATRHEADGLTADEAQRAAIEAFGTSREVAARFAVEMGRSAPPALLLELFIAAAFLGSVGLVAIGASGLVAEAMGRLLGAAFVAPEGIGVTYTAERCADFLRLAPAAVDCATAAIEHHYGEVVESRVLAGILGLIGLGVALLMRRGYRARAAVGTLPRGLEQGIGMAAFGGATALALGLGLMETAFHVPGAGSLLSAGIVSLVAFAWYVRAFARMLRLA